MTLYRLKSLLLFFFVALALPTSILVYQAYGQLKWEAFHQHQQLARELSLRIDARFVELIDREENRSLTDYDFLNVTGNAQSAFLQRSPLSQFPLEADIPGLIGYFQVDTQGQLQTPTVPLSDAADYGIDADELKLRRQQQSNLRAILGKNRLVKKRPEVSGELATPAMSEEESLVQSASSPAESLDELSTNEQEKDQQGLSVFDSLTSRSKFGGQTAKIEKSAGRVADLKLDDSYEVAAQFKEKKAVESKQKRLDKRARTEIAIMPEAVVIEPNRNNISVPADLAGLLSQQQVARIRTFESEVDPLEFSLLDSGHFVLFRRVWKDGQRYVQGLLFNQQEFVDVLIASAFEESALALMSDLVLAHRGNVVELFGAGYSREYNSVPTEGGELLYQTRLVAPFSDLELIFSLARLPVGAGGQIILWSAFVLGLVLVGGVFMLYRLGAGQISLAQKQQDFVSAISHELKTPLTSIRMYGEMLREGWADESRKKSYYDFIFYESERLSRLINNVLQLARLSRSEQKAQMELMTVGEIFDDLTPRLQSQLDQANYQLSIDCESELRQHSIKIDSDWLTQIMINLVDNAIKFSSNSEQKQLDLGCQIQQGSLQISVRDYGPGIARDQMKKVFKLFYRSENELTRETVGTGIGLSLVQQLASAMQGNVDVVNCDPGVEFRLRFALAD